MIFESGSKIRELDLGQNSLRSSSSKSQSLELMDNEPLAVNVERMKQERLQKVRELLKRKSWDACLLLDPFNQRYATGSRNMFGYFLRNSTRYIYIPAEGNVILFEYPQSQHVSEGLGTIDEFRKSKIVWSSVLSKDGETKNKFAQEIANLVKGKAKSGKSKVVAMDRCFHGLAESLKAEGLMVEDCMQDLLSVRSIKTQDEIGCLQLSMINSEAAVARVREELRPGISEQELFAKMYERVIAGGGEFVETRLLSSGERTNPWFNEASAKRLRPGELVALDTDTIGNMGYYCDFSRTFFSGPGKPSEEQKNLYKFAFEQIQHNLNILKPGLSFREVSEKAWEIPSQFVDRRYTSVMHGCGMHGEAPFITHNMDYKDFGGEGVLQPNMILCVESYIGEVDGKEGVKLEEQVRITEQGYELMSQFPFEEELLA